jgi:hypothetical protein
MTPHDDCAISVNVAWNDWRPAKARLCDLRDVHWHQPKGAPHPMLHAYVSCREITGSAMLHQCEAASAPHDIRVCVLKSHNIPAVYTKLVRQTKPTVAR